MATLIAKAAGGKWTTASTWEEEGTKTEKVPGAGDDCKLASTSGSVEVSLASKCRSLDCTGYTKTLTLNEKTLAIGTSTANGTLAAKFSEGMTVSVLGAGMFSFISTVLATELEITCAGRDLVKVQFNGTGKWKFADSFKASTEVALTRGTVNNNNQTVETGVLLNEGESTVEMKCGTGTVKAEKVQLLGTKATLAASEATFAFTKANGLLEGSEGLTFGTVSYTETEPTGDLRIGGNKATNPTVGTLALNCAGSAGLVIQSGTVVTVTGSISTNSKSGSLVKITGREGVGKIKKASGTVSLDFLELEKNTAEGGAEFYAGANSVEKAEVTGWQFKAPGATAANPVVMLT